MTDQTINHSRIKNIPEAVRHYLPAMVKDEVATLPTGQQDSFIEEYTRRSKSILVGYLTGLFGFHYLYMGKPGVFALYWAAWIFTFGIVGFIWAIIDFFRMPSIIHNYNRDVAVNVLRDLKTISSS